MLVKQQNKQKKAAKTTPVTYARLISNFLGYVVWIYNICEHKTFGVCQHSDSLASWYAHKSLGGDVAWTFAHILSHIFCCLMPLQRCSGWFTILHHPIKRISREWRVEFVINKDEVFWGTGQDMLLVLKGWTISSLSAQWLKSNNLNLWGRAETLFKWCIQES